MESNAIFDIDGNDPVVLGLRNDMAQGYLDGRRVETPEPGETRSWSYRHGFANGRAERSGVNRRSNLALTHF
jgi:hypothetical protein